MATSDAEITALVALIQRLEPKLRREVLAALARMRDGVTITELAALILGRTVAHNADPLGDAAYELAHAAGTINDAFQAAGDLTASQVASRSGLMMRFDLTNPHAVEMARANGAEFITNITAETRASLQTLIGRAMAENVSYRDLSRIIKPLIGQTVRDTRMLMDYRTSLVELGHTADKVGRLVARKAAQSLNRRAHNIAVNEIQQAANDGRLAAWRQAVDTGRLKPSAQYKWILTPDERLCRRCAAMDGKRVPIGQKFIPSNPPLHVSCRCGLGLVSA